LLNKESFHYLWHIKPSYILVTQNFWMLGPQMSQCKPYLIIAQFAACLRKHTLRKYHTHTDNLYLASTIHLIGARD